MAEYKLDIWSALAAADRRNGDWLSRQSDDARKGFKAPVFIRFASTIAGDGFMAEYALRMINERVNIGANELMSKHPELLYRLAASCGTGERQDHPWRPMAGHSHVSDKARTLIANHYPEANNEEIDLLLSLHTRASFREFALGAGLSNEDAKEAIKAYAGYAKTSAHEAEKAKPRS